MDTTEQSEGGPTPFGCAVLGLMRERGVAEASELGLAPPDLGALRRHFGGENVHRQQELPANVADALGLGHDEMVSLARAYLGW